MTDRLETSEPIDMWDRKVMYGYTSYEDGIILFRFEECEDIYYTEQKIHIDNKAIDFIKRVLND